MLLRAGSLAAPVSIVEERTVGPSLGAENIEAGLKSMALGLSLVLIFMVIWYKLFGLIANVALLGNLVIIVGVMSLIPGATMTLPGIAGIVLTVGMAVDANVLIFERIREDLRRGLSPRQAIEEGYARIHHHYRCQHYHPDCGGDSVCGGYRFGAGLRGYAVHRHPHLHVHGDYRYPCHGRNDLRSRRPRPEQTEHLRRL